MEIGDIIVMARGSHVPLVLRAYKDLYIFVGGCWLVDGTLEEGFLRSPAPIDPGFSSVMRASAWDEVGGLCQEQEFCIH